MQITAARLRAVCFVPLPLTTCHDRSLSPGLHCRQVRNKIHPTSIISGYRLAMRESCKYIQDHLALKTDKLGKARVLLDQRALFLLPQSRQSSCSDPPCTPAPPNPSSGLDPEGGADLHEQQDCRRREPVLQPDGG